jgi:pimeloyl-ACP methyl ester carboxylesterase
VHLLDVPGFGHRVTARCASTLADVASVVEAWLAQRRTPVVLAGHSTGAQVAVRVAQQCPDRVHALALAGPTFPPELRRWATLVPQIARTATHEQPGEVLAVLPEYARGRSRVLTLLRSALDDAPEDGVRRITCPITVVTGEQDGVAPAAWAETLARGRLFVLPGAHNTPFTHPRETAAALLAAL